MTIRPTKGTALAMKNCGRIEKGSPGEIIVRRAVQIDYPGAQIFPARIVFLHPQNSFAWVQYLAAARKNAVERHTLPRLTVKAGRPRVTSIRESLADGTVIA